MGWISTFFGSNGTAHQIVRSGSLLNDLSTGESAFVISDRGGTSLVSDQRGQLHQLIKNGNMTTDLSTGATYFEI